MTRAGRHHGHDRHGHHHDLEGFIARQLRPGRDRWQQRRRVLGALGVSRGAVVADVGAGPGFFTLAIARAVGPRGHVYAVDPDPAILEVLRGRLAKAGIRNVSPVLGRGDDPHVPAGICDVVLIVDTYHHFPDGPMFLRRAARALRPGGLLANVDFQKRETPVGPPVEHRVAREDFLRDARRAGLSVVAEHDFLPYQYFVVLTSRGRRAADSRGPTRASGARTDRRGARAARRGPR